jgi:hypothetical protein
MSTAKSLLVLIDLPIRMLQKIVTPGSNRKVRKTRKQDRSAKWAASQAHLDWFFPVIMLVFCFAVLFRDRFP